MKRCNKCLSDKALSEFSKDRYKKDGFSTICKECVRKYASDNRTHILKRKKNYRKNNSDKIKSYAEEWRRENAVHVKDYSEFYYEINSEKIKDNRKEYYVLHRDQQIEYALNYAKLHPEKAVAAVSKRRALKKQTQVENISGEDIKDIKEYYNYLCAYCGSAETRTCKLQIDHIYPLSLGGPHTFSNLATACPTCNYKKHNMLPLQWLKVCGRL